MANLTVINERIERLGNAERVTKAELSALSRELLEYVLLDNTGDVDAVNRMIAVLTPMNKRTAALYFPTFLPYAWDEETFKFGKKNKKAFETKLEAVKAWLAVDTNDIWHWANENIEMKKKAPKYLEQITKNIERGLADEEYGITVPEVMMAVLAAEGITAADILAALTGMQEQKDEAIANL
ncbi:MAG: hypothetical protein ACRC91_04760 [Aeromonas sp.]